MQERNSLCSVSVRHSYPGAIHIVTNNKPLNIDGFPKKKLGGHPRRISNDSISSNDSGIGFTKEEGEIQRAKRAQRVQRPHIIVLHKGKPIHHQNGDADSNLILKAATATKRNRREIAVMQPRNPFGIEEKNIPTSTEQESNPIIVDLNSNIDVSKIDDKSIISVVNVSRDETQKFDINSDTKSVVSEECLKNDDDNANVPPKEFIINSLKESTMDTISYESTESVKQIPRIRSTRGNSNFLCDSPVKKFTKSIKKLLGIGKEQRRNSVISFQKIIKKNNLKKSFFKTL